MRWGQRRRTLSAEEKAANAAARAARESASLTCQICGRAILANTGVIAHHGYERPSQFYQTKSCIGARELPFEASRDELGKYIVALTNGVDAQDRIIASIIAEERPVTRTYTAHEHRYMQRPPTSRVEFTRETFAAVKAATPEAFRHSGVHTFDQFKESDVRFHQSHRDMLFDERKICQKRFDAWERKLTPVYIDERFERWANVEKLK